MKTVIGNRTVQVLLVYLFIVNLGASLFGPVFAVFITRSVTGASLATVGFVIAIYSVIKSIVQIPLAKFLDKHKGEVDEFYALAIGSILGTTYMFALVFASQTWHLYALGMVSGLADGCLMAAYYALFSHHTDKNSQGFEWSLLSVFGLTTSVAIGGALGGTLADRLGFQSLFIIAGLINAIATLLILFLYPHLKKLKN